MMKRFYGLLLLLALWGCSQLQDATPVQRNTFLRFYERSSNYRGQSLQVLSDGFLFAGDVESGLSYNTVITRTDKIGKIIWETQIDSATTNSLLVAADGYLVFGAGIKVNTQAEQVSDVIRNSAFIAKLDLGSGSVIKKSTVKNSSNVKVNFIGNALTSDANGNVYAVGLIKTSTDRTKSFVAGINTASLDTLWFKEYGLIDRDFSNSKSAFVNGSGKILWGSSAKTTQLTKSYLTIPVVTPNSTFANNSFYGSLEDKYYSGEDIHSNAVGFGIIGTYYNTQSTSSNIFFIRTDNQGNYLDGSEKYFDGSLMNGNNDALTNKDNSSSEDSGDAITSTSDGGFLLAGSMATTPDRGNGGKDIFLIRLDAFGTVLWNKIFGGTGDETVRSIQTDADGNFVLCGTSTIAGLGSVYVMKINKDGELKD